MSDAAPPGGRLLIIGAGNMGGAMLRRWLAAGRDPASVTVVTPSGRALPDGVVGVRSLAAAGDGFDTVLLALKPQQLRDLAPDALAATGAGRLISILGGVRYDTLRRFLPDGVVVRAMPNLPVAVGHGIVALHAPTADAADRDDTTALMAPLGQVEWLADEAAFGAVTALAGCGPGFVFRFIAALSAAGAELGLDPDLADRLARATVTGSGVMAVAAEESADTLADRVASPGGSTRAGLDVLDDGQALRCLLLATLTAAQRRDAAMAALAG